MTTRADLPSHLGASFSTRAARAAGVGASRLRASDLTHPFHGVRAREALIPSGGADLAQEHVELASHYAQMMTAHGFFTHATAAAIWGMPVPHSVLADRRIDVGVLAPRRNPEGARVRGHEVLPALVSVQTHPVSGLRVASPASTWAMLGAVIRDPYDLVAAADAAVRTPRHPLDPPALTTIPQLWAAVSAGRRRGVRALRDALPRVRTGSASRPETWTRLLLVDGGLPEPVLNHDVFHEGRWLARVDLAYPDLKIAIEYEGTQHLLDAAQWASDIDRFDRLTAAGWRVIRVTKHEVFTAPGILRSRVHLACAAAAAR